MLVATGAGLVFGRVIARKAEERGDGDSLREHFGVLQGALIGFIGLVLAFGLSLAVTRYENRRADVVTEGERDRDDLPACADPRRTGPHRVLGAAPAPSPRPFRVATRNAVRGRRARDEDRLWALAGPALDEAPVDSAPRLYV